MEGLIRLQSDFGGGAAPVPPAPPLPPDDLAQARAELDQVIALQDDARYVNRDADPGFAWTEIGEASRIAAIVRDRLAPKVPSPLPPLPPSTGLQGVYGTYSGHGLAVDLYGGRTEEQTAWGPHHGLPLVAPVDGRVELYQFGTPLAVGGGDWGRAYRANWHALADGWVCRADPLQVMFVAVFWPSAPLVIEGRRVGHLHYGHVNPIVATGAIKQGQQFTTVWDSGIRFEPGVPHARAAHTHCCAGGGAQLSPNGDLPGRLAVVAQGWAVRDIETVPGPSDYQSGQFCAGRRLSDFTQGGHPIPPMPS